MKLLIFKTDIKTKGKLSLARRIFNAHPAILKWTVDTEDIDKVLRIEAYDDLSETQVIRLLEPLGLKLESLPE